jgi:hypothetical protein
MIMVGGPRLVRVFHDRDGFRHGSAYKTDPDHELPGTLPDGKGLLESILILWLPGARFVQP